MFILLLSIYKLSNKDLRVSLTYNLQVLNNIKLADFQNYLALFYRYSIYIFKNNNLLNFLFDTLKNFTKEEKISNELVYSNKNKLLKLNDPDDKNSHVPEENLNQSTVSLNLRLISDKIFSPS